MAERLPNDIGGLAAGPVDKEERRLLFWEKQMLAAIHVLQDNGVITRDEERRALEEMPPAYHETSEHYQRRLDGVIRLLAEKGIVSEDEVESLGRDTLAKGTRDHV